MSLFLPHFINESIFRFATISKLDKTLSRFTASVRHVRSRFALRRRAPRLVAALVRAAFAAVILCSLGAIGARAQEIALEHCDSLPVLEMKVSGQPKLFLLDTAANSMLNLKSFPDGKVIDMRVTSWAGTAATDAKEVELKEIVVGDTKIVGVRLPAIDLSAVGKACGRKIDGILGVDLLSRLGVTINLKQQSMHIRTMAEEHEAELAAQMHHEMAACVDAFNDSKEEAFGECIDQKVVFVNPETELYGREQVIRYFQTKYFHQEPAARLDMEETSFHTIGDAVWYEYGFSIATAKGIYRGRGMAMCRKTDGKWRMATMHHSVAKFEPTEAEAGSR